jgi:hypothetical protein
MGIASMDGAARVFTLSMFVLGTLAAPAGQATPAPQAPVDDASAILGAARGALGGEKLLSIKTVVIQGRTRQIQGDNLVPIEFEISCELPDRCVRRDEVPARESGPTTIGFIGDELIQFPAPPFAPGGPVAAPPRGGGGSPPQVAASRVNTAKQDFARWWLGMFAGSFSSFPLTYTRIGQAEAPQGQADVLEVKGPSGFTARLFILKDTHLPIMLSWQGQGPGQARGQGVGQAPGQTRGQTPGPPAEQRLYYADYRDVDGFKLPFRLRRAAGADTTEETNVDRFRVNVRIDPRKFEGQR